MAVWSHGAEITCMIPSVGIECLSGGLFVLVVSKHDIGASCKYLTRNVLWVGRVNSYFHVVDGSTAGGRDEVLIVTIADERSTLGSSIANSNGEADIDQELFYLTTQGCTADDDLVGTSAKGLIDLLAYLLLNLLRDNRHLQQQSHTVVLNLRKHPFAYNLLNHQWHGDDDGRLDGSEGLGNNGGRWQTGEKEEVTAAAETVEELYAHAIHVRHRKNGQHIILRLDGQASHTEVKVAPQSTIRQHDTL